MNDFNFSLDNIRTSFLGYNKSEMRSRMSMLSNSFNALSEQLEKEIAKNKKLEDSLSKKNIECYELEKENRTLKLNLQGGTPASNITQINSMREEKEILKEMLLLIFLKMMILIKQTYCVLTCHLLLFKMTIVQQKFLQAI